MKDRKNCRAIASLPSVVVAQVLFDFGSEVPENKQLDKTCIVSRASYLCSIFSVEQPLQNLGGKYVGFWSKKRILKDGGKCWNNDIRSWGFSLVLSMAICVKIQVRVHRGVFVGY